MVTVAKPENAVEAQALLDLFQSEGVPHVAKPYSLDVLPGVSSGRGQWGAILVPPADEQRARELIQAFRDAGVDDAELERQARDVSFRFRSDD
ncbi:MAG: putative signal transducing protein [Myxococcota bacterium]